MKCLVLCHGTFDLFHYGHLQYLKAARRLGSWLVVSLTSDEFVNKGPGRPVFNESQRAEMIAALSIVDRVEICRSKTAIPMIEKYKPDIYFKGADYKSLDKHGYLETERLMVEALGGRLVLSDTPLFSSTKLLETIRESQES